MYYRSWYASCQESEEFLSNVIIARCLLSGKILILGNCKVFAFERKHSITYILEGHCILILKCILKMQGLLFVWKLKWKKCKASNSKCESYFTNVMVIVQWLNYMNERRIIIKRLKYNGLKMKEHLASELFVFSMYIWWNIDHREV